MSGEVNGPGHSLLLFLCLIFLPEAEEKEKYHLRVVLRLYVGHTESHDLLPARDFSNNPPF